jgi:hypothetical protein
MSLAVSRSLWELEACKESRLQWKARVFDSTSQKRSYRKHLIPGECMAKNHYVTKPKRRNKNANRKDPSNATMAKLRAHAAADSKTSAK